jgi:hypothetical protein
MNMIPTQPMQQLIKNQMTAFPLTDGEIRRIEGMGELYVSLTRDVDKRHHEYTYMYSLIIDGKKFYFFSRLSGY